MTESGPGVPPSRPGDGDAVPTPPSVSEFVPPPFFEQVPVPPPRSGADAAEPTLDPDGPAEPAGDRPEGALPGDDAGDGPSDPLGDAEIPAEADGEGPGDPADASEGDPEGDSQGDSEGDSEDGEQAEESDDAEESDEDDEDEFAEEPDPRRVRFNELVEERLARARYSHPMLRAVMTPEEIVVSALVERRASVWVPASTFSATIVSAVSAVVLAAKLHSDPSEVNGSQVLVVLITVSLLAASFVVLLRSEVHFERIRPKGRMVRADVADAYETVRDAPRRLVDAHADHEVLVRVAGLLPAAERLVDSLVEYTTMGGVKIKAHPAYDRLLRMRAEIEAIEIMLDEAASGGAERPLPEFAPLPRAEQVSEYESLSDIASFIDGYGFGQDDPIFGRDLGR